MLEIDLQPRLVGGRDFFDLRPAWFDERLAGLDLSLVDQFYNRLHFIAVVFRKRCVTVGVLAHLHLNLLQPRHVLFFSRAKSCHLVFKLLFLLSQPGGSGLR